MKNLGRALACSLIFANVARSETESGQYFDPTDQRIHAAVESEITNGQLHLIISAIGAQVEPLPGFRGLGGSNLQTAFEIDQLIAGDKLDVITTDTFGNRYPGGYLMPGKRGNIPVRRLKQDGTIEFDALSEESYLLDFRASGSALPAGEFRTELWARGEPRLRVDYLVDEAGNGSLLNFEEIRHGKKPPRRAFEQFRYIDTEGEEEPKEVTPPIDLGIWNGRDIEAKWTLFKKSLDDGKHLSVWVDFLASKKEFELLEMIAMHEIDGFSTQGIGEKLKKANAPNWLRLTFWIASNPKPRGHGGMVTDGLVYDKAKQNVISSWIRANQLSKQHGPILSHFEAEDPKPKKVDVSKYSPPHKAEIAFKHLDAPEKLEVLDTASKKAAADTVYLHQVRRAIDALVVSGYYSEPWLGKLEKLRTHQDPLVRQAVYLAHTHMGAPLVPQNTLAVTNDHNEEKIVREAALLAHSYRQPFEIYPDLLDIASDPKHAANRAALSRLGEIGDGFALAKLASLENQDAAVKATSAKIKKRIDISTQTAPFSIIYPALQRAAWMKTVGSDDEIDYTAWLDVEVKKHITTIRPNLATTAKSKLVTKYGSPEEQKALSEKLTAALQELANRYAKTP